MRSTLTVRLARLEAQSQGDPVDPWTPPVFPEGWLAEVFAILAACGQLDAVLESLSCDTPSPPA